MEGYGIAFGTIFSILYQRARFNPPAVQVVTVDDPDLSSALSGILHPQGCPSSRGVGSASSHQTSDFDAAGRRTDGMIENGKR